MNDTKSPLWVIKTLMGLAVLGTALVFIIIGTGYFFVSKNLPQIESLKSYNPAIVTQIISPATDKNKPDAVIAEFFKERRYIVEYGEIPPQVIKAFVSAEDDSFFEHQGINPLAMLRAFFANLKSGHYKQGGSTITQQVAKSLLLTPEKSLIRKIKELLISYQIEKKLKKEEILFLYLNQIYLGSGSYGVQAASKTYFNKNVKDITLAEAAVLAGLPQAPGKYSPNLNPKKAKERQLYVLRRMLETKSITQSEMSEAAAQPIKIYDYKDINKEVAPYYVEHIRRILAEKYGDEELYTGGLTVKMAVSVDSFVSGKKQLRRMLREYDKTLGYRGVVKNLKNNEEIEEALKEIRYGLIEESLGFQMFMPDGHNDALEAIKVSGFSSEQDLLKNGELYKGIITSLDEKKLSLNGFIGSIRFEIPIERFKWARIEPKNAFSIFKKGDVIWVGVTKTKEQVQYSLEQVPEVQSALFSLETFTGNVLAMEGGYDFKSSEFNRALQAQRQPGSVFKPVIYAAGLNKGFTPASIIEDSPIVYDEGDNGKWKPSNFEEKFYGDTTFRQALIKSRNIPTIKIVQSVRVSKLIDFSKKIGLNAQFSEDLSIALGSISTSVMDMTMAYTLFPRLGKKVVPIFYKEITDRFGKVLESIQPSQWTPPRLPAVVEATNPTDNKTVVIPDYPQPEDPDLVMDPRVAYVMTHLMKEVVSHGTGYKAKDLGRVSAGKTGTTSDYIDAWFIGFTPQVVTGVWSGFDSQKTIGPMATGAKVSLPIWLEYMKDVANKYPNMDFPVPQGVVFATVDASSGKLASANSSNSIREAFVSGTEPTEVSAGNEKTESRSKFFKEDIE